MSQTQPQVDFTSTAFVVGLIVGAILFVNFR